MGSGVFIHRADSIYDDSPAERYHFPAPYLRRVEACVGNWIVYYEPRKVTDSRGYFAVTHVQQVIPDPRQAGMYFAVITEGSYMEFSNPVPFSGDEGLIERGLLNSAGKISARAQSAARTLALEDLNRIVDAGFTDIETSLPRREPLELGMSEENTNFEFEHERISLRYYASRILRDGIFRKVGLRAYDSRCAITGLKLINGGGRAEV